MGASPADHRRHAAVGSLGQARPGLACFTLPAGGSDQLADVCMRKHEPDATLTYVLGVRGGLVQHASPSLLVGLIS